MPDLFNQIIIDWWENDNELCHQVFKALPESPLDFRDITHTGESFCVWELAVIALERDAWIETVLPYHGSCQFGPAWNAGSSRSHPTDSALSIRTVKPPPGSIPAAPLTTHAG